MIRKHLKILIITSVIVLLPVLTGIIFWNQLPDQLPIHWNAAGEVDGRCGKAFGVFGMPLILLAIQWLGITAMAADPKRAGHSGRMLQLSFWLIPLLSLIVNALTYATALGVKMPVNVIISTFLGLLFIIIGNYMPRCRQNYTMGIKLPWTLHSEENWNRTHRMAGKLWMIGGFLMMASSFFGKTWLTIAILIPMALVPMIYSWTLYRRGI